MKRKKGLGWLKHAIDGVLQISGPLAKRAYSILGIKRCRVKQGSQILVILVMNYSSSDTTGYELDVE